MQPMPHLQRSNKFTEPATISKTKVLLLYLESELATNSPSNDSTAIVSLHHLLAQSAASEFPAMFAAMRLANEHHSAIFATKFPESIQSEIVGTDAPHDFAKKIWQSHARHELPFIRARAAYALAELGENIEYQADEH